MKIIYKFGPHAGEISHCPRSQEIDVLLKAGIIEEVPLTDAEQAALPAMREHTIPAMPPAGWQVARITWGDEQKLVIVKHDGLGGRFAYDGPPPAQRRWDGEKYVYVPTDCPASVIAEYHALAGNAKEAAKAREQAAREARLNAEEAVARNKGGNLAAIARMTYGKQS